MSERIDRFLAAAGFGGASRRAIAGDLSSRRFDRVTYVGQTAILMDAGPGDPSTAAFVAVTEWLRDADLSAPEIFAADPAEGLALVEDLGDARLADLVRARPSLQPELYGPVLDTLCVLHDTPILPLAQPDASDLAQATALADEWYPGADARGLADARMALRAALDTVLSGQRATVSLRDFHAENILWLPDRAAHRRAGLVDYQDAFLTHPVYDLMSLATDARVDVPAEVRDALLEGFARATGLEGLRLAFDTLAVQRNLRILGIFARAARRDGKRQHLAAMPRVWGYLTNALENPGLADLRAPLLSALPPPDGALIERLSQ